MKEITFPIAQVWGMLLRAHPDLPEMYKNPQLAFSYPLLTGAESGLHIAWFIYPTAINRLEQTIHRPLAIVQARWSAEKLDDIHVRRDPPEFAALPGTFPFTRPPVVGKAEVTAAEVHAAYTPLLELFPDRPSGEAGAALAALLDRVVHPLLMPFYQATAPRFLDWLAGGRAAP